MAQNYVYKNIKGGLKMTIGNLENVIKMNLQLLAGEGEEGNEQNYLLSF